MQKRSYYIINSITLYRVLTAPVLLYLIFSNQPEVFKLLLPVSFFTDAIDGYLARKYKVLSVFGSRMDSLGDDLTILAGLVGLYIFKTEFVFQHLQILVALFIFFIIQIIISYIRYRKMTSFHTYFAKIAAVLQGSFLILVFFLANPPLALFYAACIFTFLDLAEEIILVALLPKWETNVKGLYWILKRRKHKK
jgi:phosphatidylglycerophosphate synthase